MVSFKVTKLEEAQIKIVMKRAVRLAKLEGESLTSKKKQHLEMDITAAHANGCALDFTKLLGFDDASFGHDVWGIRKYMNRCTGKLTDFFVPRCAKSNEAKS